MNNPTVNAVLLLCVGRLDNEMWCEIEALNACGEAETALSLICTELTQSDVSITVEISEAIRAAAIDLGLGDSFCPHLEALVRD